MSEPYTIVGEALVDLVAGPDGRFSAHPGGSPFNVAVALARLDHRTALVARVGRDGFGRLLRETAAGEGVGLEHWVDAAEPTALAVATLDDTGQAQYEFYLDGTAALAWDADALAQLPLDGGGLHVGSLASWWGASAAAVHDLQVRARTGGRTLVSYDPNVRPALLPDRAAAIALVERNVAAAHVVKASAEDLSWLYPMDTPAAVAERWCALGATWVVVTDGGAGATGFAPGGQSRHQPAPAVLVVDTVGAGDAFAGALLSGLADVDLQHPEALRAAVADDDERLAAVLGRAVAAGAMTCERAGARPPTRTELTARTGA